LNQQAKLEVARRALLLERDTLLRQQKIKTIFGAQDGVQLDSRFGKGGLEDLKSNSVLAQQLGP